MNPERRGFADLAGAPDLPMLDVTNLKGQGLTRLSLRSPNTSRRELLASSCQGLLSLRRDHEYLIFKVPRASLRPDRGLD